MSGADDSLTALYQRWRAAEDAGAAASDRASAIRKRLTRIYGEAGLGLTDARALWGKDPTFPALRRAIEESNSRGGESSDLAGEIFALDACGVAGVLVKVRIAIEWAEPPSDETAYGHEIALAALKDVERVLEEVTRTAPDQAALMRDFEALPRYQQWSFLIKALNHYAEGLNYAAKPQELSQAEVAA